MTEEHINDNNLGIISKIDLFEFINCFFTDSEKFSRITDTCKQSNIFMLNRFLAIHYPKEIQMLNTVHNVTVAEALHLAMKSNKVPYWIYTSAKKISESIIDTYSTDVKLEFCKIHNIEYQSFDQMYVIYPKFVLEELKNIKYLHDQNIKKSKTTKQKT